MKKTFNINLLGLHAAGLSARSRKGGISMRNKLFIIGAVIAAGALLLAATVAADEGRPANYVALRLGQFAPTGDLKNGEYEPAEDFEAIYGRYFSPYFALEGGFHHFRAKSDVIRTIRIEQFMIANGVVLTPKVLYPGERFELYVGIGVGRYWVMNEAWFHGPFETVNTEIKDTITGYHVLAGASYDLSRKWYLGLEGMYVKLLDFLGETDITGRAVSLGIGLRF